jgi:hypothetical protein
MAANKEPIFPATPNISWGTISAANTAKDGSGTVVTVFTAGLNGSRVDAIKVRPLGANVATVLRIFVNNGNSNSTPTNNILFHEVTIPAVASVSEVSAQPDTAIRFDGVSLPQLVLEPNYKLNVTIGTAVAAGLAISAIGGDY